MVYLTEYLPTYSPSPLTEAASQSPIRHCYHHVYGCDDDGDACGDDDGGAYGVSTVLLILRRRIDGVCGRVRIYKIEVDCEG